MGGGELSIFLLLLFVWFACLFFVVVCFVFVGFFVCLFVLSILAFFSGGSIET